MTCTGYIEVAPEVLGEFAARLPPFVKIIGTAEELGACSFIVEIIGSEYPSGLRWEMTVKRESGPSVLGGYFQNERTIFAPAARQ